MTLTFPDRRPRSPQTAALRWPLPLPEAGWGADDAHAAVLEAAEHLPEPVEPATVVSALTTVVLRAGQWAAKVYPPGTDAGHVARTAAALAGSRTALLPEHGPVRTRHGVVTFTPWVTDTVPVTWPELGSLLARFHTDHRDADLPTWTPLSRLPQQVAGLPDHAATVLLTARTTLLAALEDVGSVLGVGAIHGDVSLGNALGTTAGARLIDIDWVARGPREYDLAASSRRVRNGEIDSDTYRGFCDAYGFDVLTWDGLVVLDKVADLSGVAFRLWDSRRRGLPLDWVAAELDYWYRPL